MTDITPVLIDNLTPDQLAAAQDLAAEVLTLACAGSGKSRTLAFRIARLVAEEENPGGIVAFTFTDKAAESIKRAVAGALVAAGLNPLSLGVMFIGTIHSFCQYILGEMDAQYRQFEVLDDNRLLLYLISRYPQLGLHQLRRSFRQDPGYFDLIREVAAAWKTANDELIDLEQVYAQNQELGEVLLTLRGRLQTDQFIDFSLMIRLVVEALRDGNPNALRAVRSLRHLMVDEYQDVNPSQEALIAALHRLSSTLFVVGDDDQSIYAWRGADVTNILTFQNRYPSCSVHTLTHNFRSTPAIVTAANDLASAELGPTRIAKNPTADQPQGSRQFAVLWFNDRDAEANWVADRIEALLGTTYYERNGTARGLTPGDFAILMRSTRQPEGDDTPRHEAFTTALAARDLPFTLKAGGGIFDRPQVGALYGTFELLRAGPIDREAARQHFERNVLPAFPNADFARVAAVLATWGRLIHSPINGPRRRVFPQQLVHDLLSAFGIASTPFDAGVMQDLGLFSRIIQDVEGVYLSIDTADRYRDVLNFLANIAQGGYDTSTNDVLRRPDAVTVSTVHQMKGLEFPVVFVSDVEAQRFPKNRSRYRGWLPQPVMAGALARGAYQSTPEEEARLFYTAVTRAERYLYVTGSRFLPGGNSARKQSPFMLRLAHQEIVNDATLLPTNLSASTRMPRIDETVVPTSYSDIRYYLRCPYDYQLRKGFGFSPSIPEMFGFGATVHTSVEKLHEVFAEEPPTRGEAEQVARDTFHLKHIAPSRDPLNRPGAYERACDRAAQMCGTYAESYGTDFTRRRQIEVRFEVPVRQAVISGSIDLMLQIDANNNITDATVIDFKAMEGGEEPEENERLYWTEVALQVQLYAMAANEVLGENARTGSVHFLRDNRRVDVPIDGGAIDAAVSNVEWAVDRIIAGDFPMRPHPDKCGACDFKALCPQRPQTFASDVTPPPLHVPGPAAQRMARAFSQFAQS